MAQVFVNDKGQAVIESIGVLLMAGVVFVLLGSTLLMSWRSTVAEQIAYECARCAVTTTSGQFCEQKYSKKFGLFSMAPSQRHRVSARSWFEKGFCKLDVKEGEKWKSLTTEVSLKDIKRDSRSYFLRQ